MFYPNFEPFRTKFSKKSDMNADCAHLSYIRVGNIELTQVQRQTQLNQKPQYEGVVEI